MTINTLFHRTITLKRSNDHQSSAVVFFVAKLDRFQRRLMMYMYHLHFFKLSCSFPKNNIVPLFLLTDRPPSFAVNAACAA